jgi:putative ABC transport system substrate-binding protein
LSLACQNLTIEYRWAEDHLDRLPTMATDLVRHQMAVIVATGSAASLAAKAATTTLPIVFETSGDPVKLGLVGSLSRPGGNLTGVSQLGEEAALKRLELLHELLPTARAMALLVNPAEPLARDQVRVSLAAAKTLGLELHVLNASIERDLDAAFAKLSASQWSHDRRRYTIHQSYRTARYADSPASDSCGLPTARVRRRRRLSELWRQ